MTKTNSLDNDLSSCSGLPLSTGVTGNLSVTHLNSGSGASSTSFWRGDGTWDIPTGTGVMSVSGTLNRITSSGGTNPIIDISASYVGQASLTTLGTVSTGTWNGTVISPQYGGTGVNNGTSMLSMAGNHVLMGAFSSTFTFTNTTSVIFPTTGTLATTSQIPTGAPLTATNDTNVTVTLGGSPTTALVTAASLTLGWTGNLSVTRGGTGLNTLNQGDLLYGSALNIITALPKDINATRYLSNSGTSNNPLWSQVNLANGVIGNLPVTNLNSGTGALSTTYWRGDGTWDQINLSTDVTGNLSTTHLNSGTGASSTTYWRGDATWDHISLSTDVTGNLPVTNLDSGTGASVTSFWRGDGTWAAVGGGTVGTGTINDLAYYPATGDAITGLATANNGVLKTDGTGVPSISSTLPSAVQSNITGLGTVITGTWQATAITPTYGGTGATATPTNGQLLIGNGTNYSVSAITPGTGINVSNGSGSITISATSVINAGTTNQMAWYASSGSALSGLATANNSVLCTSAGGVPSITNVLPTGLSLQTPSSVVLTNGTGLPVSGLATGNSNAVLVTNNSGLPSWTSPLTNGQLVIGSTGTTPATATLTAGSGVSITNGAGAITINAAGGGQTWTSVVGTSVAATIDSGYITLNATVATITLPATAPIGSKVSVYGSGPGGWIVAANTGQTIKMGPALTSSGGNISSASRYDTIDVVCIVANTTWTVISSVSIGLTFA